MIDRPLKCVIVSTVTRKRRCGVLRRVASAIDARCIAAMHDIAPAHSTCGRSG
jgi:hypothetical protein